jgi:ABC-2 type transport system permease protein
MSTRMVVDLLRFDARFLLWRVVTFGLALTCAGMSLAMVVTGFATDGLPINAPYPIMLDLSLLSQWMLLTQTILVAASLLRDDEHGMRELIGSRPVHARQLLLVRLGGVVLAGALIQVIAIAVLAVAPLLIPLGDIRTAPFSPIAYAWGFLTLTLPNLLLTSALLGIAALVIRSVLGTYAAGIALFAAYIVTALLVDSPIMARPVPPTPEMLARASILDLFGASAFFEQARYWTPAEREVRLVSLEGRYLLNRLLVLAITACVVAGAAWRSTRALRRPIARAATPVPSRAPSAARYAPLSPDAGAWRRWWHAFVSAARLELQLLYTSRIIVALGVLWVLVASIEIQSSLRVAEYGTRILAVSAYLAGRMDEAGVPFITLMLAYVAAEVVWRERLARIDGLIDATPASNGAMLLAKLTVLCSLPVVLTLLGLAVAVLFHLSNAGLPVRPLAYLAELWYLSYPLILFGVVVLVIQVAAPDRWSGIVASLAVVMLREFGSELGLEHPIWRFGAAPRVVHSELDGYGAGAWSFALFMGYWSLVALTLLLIGWGVWRRGRVDRLATRVRTGWQAVGTGGRMTLLMTAGAAVVSGATLHRATVERGGWRSSAAQVEWRIGYEQRYRRLSMLPHPALASLDLTVALLTTERVAEVQGIARLVNQTDLPIDTIWLAFQRDITVHRLALAGEHSVGSDSSYATHWLVPSAPLMPGDSAELRFATRIDRGGARAVTPSPDVAGNGSFLLSTTVQPWFGYLSRYEVQSPTARADARLGAPSPAVSLSDSLDARSARTHAGRGTPWIMVHTIISTAADQEPFAPGNRLRRWSQDGRAWAEFSTPAPINPAFALASGRFQQQRLMHRGVELEFWHHPDHDVNAERILRIAATSLDELSARFGPYPHAAIRMVEVPESWGFGAFAAPGMLFLTEHRGVLTDHRRGDVDLLTRRVAHEVGHQWWGHTVAPLTAPGSLTLIEGLAKYAEQRVIASVHGERAIPPILAFDHDRFLRGRATDPDSEPTLMSVTDQDHLVYGKAAIGFWALHRALGDAAMTRALRGLVRDEGGARGAATMRTLRDRLHAEATTAAQHELIDEWLAGRVLYDLRADSLLVTSIGDSSTVMALFTVRQLHTQGGREVEHAMPAGSTMRVTIADSAGTILSETDAPVHDNIVRLSARLRGVPTSAEIDPYIEHIDRDRSNNRVRATVRR